MPKNIPMYFTILCVVISCGGGDGGGNGEPNQQLSAMDDEYAVEKNTQVSFSVLDNDVIPEGRNVSISIPEDDELSVVDNTIRYSAPNIDNFTKRFTYTISDNEGNFAQANVSITAARDTGNARLTPSYDLAVVALNQSVVIDVLENDSSSIGDSLDITGFVQNPTNGTATISDNKIIYTPNEDYHGYEYLTYRVEDQSGNSYGGVTVNVLVEAKVEDRYVELKLDSIRNYHLSETGSAHEEEYLHESSVIVEGIGDYNGDGFDDVIACYPKQSVSVADEDIVQAGECYIVVGTATLADDREIKTIAQTRIVSHIPNTTLGLRIEPAGDVNQDGFDDVIIFYVRDNKAEGAMLLGTEGLTNEVVFLSDATIPDEAIIHFSSNNTLLNIKSIGDINNDQFDDLMFIYDVQVDGETSREAIVWFGDTNFQNVDIANMRLPTDGLRLVEGTSSALFPAESFRFGSQVTRLGDINQDGFDDFALRATNDIGITDEPGAFIFFGKNSFEKGAQTLSTSDGAFIRAPNLASQSFLMGDSGDFNGDGNVDLLVARGTYNSGEIKMYSLTDISPGIYDEDARIITSIPRTSPFNIGTVSMLNLGDVNGDNIQDFAIQNQSTFRTQLALMYGSTTLSSQFEIDSLKFENGGDGSKGAIIHDEDYNISSVIGIWSASLGDFNGDGFSDFVIGGIGEEENGRGEVTLLFGDNHWGIGN